MFDNMSAPTMNPLETILKDMGEVPEGRSLLGLPIENIKGYFNKVALDDQVYQRFMGSMRMLRAPILARLPRHDLVAELMKSLETGQDLKFVAEHFREILYQAQTMDMTIPMLQMRSFRL